MGTSKKEKDMIWNVINKIIAFIRKLLLFFCRFLIYAVKIKKVRTAFYIGVGFLALSFLFYPPLLFGDKYRKAERKLIEELAEARRCPLPWRNIEGLRAFTMVLVSLEHRSFFSLSTWIPLDPRGIIRATINNLLSLEIIEGGSSLQWQIAKLINGGPIRERSVINKLMEVRLSMNLRGVPHDGIITLYSQLLDCGLSDEQGIISCGLALYGKLPEDLSPEEGAALAAMQSSPSVFRNKTDLLNIRVAKGVSWLKEQNVYLDFVKEGNYIAPFGNYPYFRGYQPPSSCYLNDRETWVNFKILTEAYGNAISDLRKRAILKSNDTNISLGGLLLMAKPPYKAVTRIGGMWTDNVPVLCGSILKPLIVEIYIRWLSSEKVNQIQIPVGLCVLDLSLRPYCPQDIGNLSDTYIKISAGIAKSVNSSSIASLLLLPYFIFADNPKNFSKFVRVLTDEEISRYSLWPDRVLGAKIISEILGREIKPSEIPKELSYRTAQLAALRHFKLIVKEYTGFEIRELLSSILGADIKIPPSALAKAYAKLFFPSGNCNPSTTALLLGMQAKDGSLKATVGQAGDYPAKTGTTDYSVIAVIGACASLDNDKNVPLISLIVAADHQGSPIDPLKASLLGEGFISVKNEIEKFGYELNPPQ